MDVVVLERNVQTMRCLVDRGLERVDSSVVARSYAVGISQNHSDMSMQRVGVPGTAETEKEHWLDDFHQMVCYNRVVVEFLIFFLHFQKDW